MKCPEHPNTELKKLPYNKKLRYGNHRYICPIDNHEWVIYKSLLPKKRTESE